MENVTLCAVGKILFLCKKTQQLQCVSNVHVVYTCMFLFALLVSIGTCVFCESYVLYMCLCGGRSNCSTLYKHISWADSAQQGGEGALRQPGTEAS